MRVDCNEYDLVELRQEGLSDDVIEALGLDVGTVNGKTTRLKPNH